MGALPNCAQIPRRRSLSSHQRDIIEQLPPRSNLNLSSPIRKRRRSRSPHGAVRQQFTHISPPHSASPPPGPSAPLPSRSPVQSSFPYDYSLMSPRDAEYYRKYSKLYKLQPPSNPNNKGRMGNSPEEVDASIVRFIKPLVEEDPEWTVYMQSTTREQVVSEVLKQYRFVQAKVDELRAVSTPIFWDGAPGLLIEKVRETTSSTFHALIHSPRFVGTHLAKPGYGFTQRSRMRRNTCSLSTLRTPWVPLRGHPGLRYD